MEAENYDSVEKLFGNNDADNKDLGELLLETERKLYGKNDNRQLKAVDIADFLGMEIPPRENILHPFLKSQSSTMIYGIRGVGKTHVSIGVAVAIAGGGDFLGWKAEKPTNVLFVDGEMPAALVQERFSRRIVSADYDITAKLNIITPDLQEYGMPDVSTQQGQLLIEEHLTDVKVVILDNISTLCRSGRENEGEAWLPIQEWALKLRRAGIATLFIHHAGKGGLQRGTSRREDILDTVISLKRPADYRADEGARFEVHFDKARGLYGDDVKPLEAMLTEKDGRLIWVCKSVEDSLTEKVAHLLNEGLKQAEIAEELNVSKGTISKHKNKAVAMSLIRGDK